MVQAEGGGGGGGRGGGEQKEGNKASEKAVSVSYTVTAKTGIEVFFLFYSCSWF